jgi:hypothetical protein
MCGNLGAAGFSLLIGLLLDKGQWLLMMSISGTALALVTVCWFFIDPTKVLGADDGSE